MVNFKHEFTEETLFKNGQHLSRIYDSAGVVLFYLSVESDDCFRFLTINQSFMEATGLDKDQIVGKRIEDVIPEPSVSMVRQKYKEAIRKKQIVRWEETSEYPAGIKVGEVSVTPFFNNDGVCTHLVGSVHDITERKRMEEALRKSEELAKASLNATSDMVYLTDRNGILLAVNDNAARRLDKSPHEIIGTNIFDYFSYEVATKRKEKGDIVIGSGKPLHYQDERKGRVFNISIYPTFDKQKNVDRLAVYVSDITEHNKAVEQLKELNADLEHRVTDRTAEAEKKAEQLAALARQLTQAEQRERSRISRVLHDHFQQLLVAVRLHTDMARNLAHTPRIINCLDQALAMLDETLEASRSLAVELSPPILLEGGLIPALQWLARQMHAKHELTVHFTADGTDETEDNETKILFFEAVRELLFNVVKHAGTAVAHMKLERNTGMVRITIRDEGVGFDSSAMRFTGDDKIGLYNILSRLQLLGGTMDLNSAVGEGTSVTIQAPLGSGLSQTGLDVSPPINEVTDQQLDTTTISDKIRVLLVDDHQVMREGLAMLLESEPDIAVIAQASSGERSVELARELHPDVIVMDKSMPGMDGCEATRLIVSDCPEIHVIGLSMHTDRSVAAQMREAGAAAYIAKGGPSEMLINMIRSLAGDRGTA